MIKITKDEFKKHMQILVDFEQYVSKLDSVGFPLWERTEYSYLEMNYISMLKQLAGIDEEDETIEYYLLDVPWIEEDKRYTMIGDKKFYLRNLDELYEALDYGNN